MKNRNSSYMFNDKFQLKLKGVDQPSVATYVNIGLLGHINPAHFPQISFIYEI